MRSFNAIIMIKRVSVSSVTSWSLLSLSFSLSLSISFSFSLSLSFSLWPSLPLALSLSLLLARSCPHMCALVGDRCTRCGVVCACPTSVSFGEVRGGGMHKTSHRRCMHQHHKSCINITSHASTSQVPHLSLSPLSRPHNMSGSLRTVSSSSFSGAGEAAAQRERERPTPPPPGEGEEDRERARERGRERGRDSKKRGGRGRQC